MNKYQQLIQEILYFGRAIDHNDAESTDYQQACRLFYDYLSAQITELNHPVNPSHTPLNEKDRNTLNKLIMPEEYTSKPCSQWINTIFNYCQQLQKTHRLSA